MKGQELIIKFLADKAFLSEHIVLSLEQLDLPNKRSFKKAATWTVKVINYIAKEERLHVDVLSYTSGEQPFPIHQQLLEEKLKKIKKISFKSIDTFAYLGTSKGTNKAKTYKPLIESPPLREEHTQSSNVVSNQREYTLKISETFFVPLKKIQFRFGYVSFSKRILQLDSTIKFKVHNQDIREEFDAIKNYFGNVLNTKKIKFETVIQITDGEVTDVECKSTEISRIDQTLIDTVKFEFVKSMTKKRLQVDIEKSLFTMDEFFDTLSEESINANVFYENENQLIDDLLQITNTKHYKQLRYLSSKHAHAIMKLRLVLKPFSFVFLIEGERHFHIIWETLNTAEATYIWHEDKDIAKLKLSIRKIDNIINTIKAKGKIAYINTTEDPFRRIYHDYSELVEGFIKWKGELESILT